MKYFFGFRMNYINVLICLIISRIFAINPEHPWDAITGINYSPCKNYRCRERARYVDESLDTSVKPCEDFYQYACGGWIRKHPVPTTEVEYSLETYLKLISMEKLKRLLEQEDHSTDKEEVRIARKLYRECMKRHELGRLDTKTVKFHLDKQEPWTSCLTNEHSIVQHKSWLSVLKYFLEITNDGPLFDISINLNKNNEPTIELEEVTVPFVMLDVLRWNEKKEQLYAKFLKRLIESLKIFKYENCRINDYIQEVLKFRKKLNDILEYILDTTANQEVPVEELTIEQFQNWYDTKTEKLRAKANIPWLDVIRAAYPTINNSTVTKDTKINVRNMEYFRLLAPLRAIVNHILLYFVEGHMKMDPKLIKILKEIILRDDTFYDDLMIDTDKLHFCIVDHPMTTVLARMYNNAFLTKTIEQNVFSLAYDIKEMLKLQMAESTWLHSVVKYEIGRKLSRTNTHIGVRYRSKRYKQRPWVHAGNSSMIKMIPSILPEAAYILEKEYVLIGTGYLQSPVYDEDMPFVVNYGSLGTLLGHEFFHSFQSAISTKYSGKTEKGMNITSNIYQKKTECFVEHYKNFAKDLKDLSADLYVTPDLVRAVDENVADTMGLKGAYEAYRKKLWQNGSLCQYLPTHKQLTCDQLFFVSFALTFCGNIPSMEIRKILKHLAHLPSRIRVNGAVSNMKAFSDAFHCTNKAPLNPKLKCDIWE